ncbi:MAG: hypothetical protein ABJZ55_20455 [Fuerstiella sp.]
MITGVIAGLVGLASANAGGLLAGSAVGVAAEVALPWVTRATRARRVARLLRKAPLSNEQKRVLHETV